MARLTRGVLAAAVAIGSAAGAHAAAGHHAPHAVVLVLALAISVPVCVQLAGVRLSRIRLVAAVLASQTILHGLFALFPASTAGGLKVSENAAGHHGQAHLLWEASTPPDAASHVVSSQAETAMIAAHVGAAALSYGLLRRGDVILQTLADLLMLRPVVLLLTGEVWPAPRCPGPAPTPEPRQILTLWLGEGPRTLRGPPRLVLR